jgi:PAS domain S-box-containing protein
MPNLNIGIGGWFGASRKNKTLLSLSEHMIDGFAYHKVLFDKNNKPVDYVFLEVNDAFEQITGLKREKILGKRVTEALPGIEKDPADWIGVYGKVALTCEPIRFENFNQALGKWFVVSAFCPEKGYFVATFEDITARKQAEEALRESAVKFKTVADFTYDWEYWISPNGEMVYVSPSCERVTGYGADEFIKDPKMLTKIVHPEDKSIVGSHFDLIGSAELHNVDFRILTREGETRWISHACRAVFDDNGKWIGRRANNRDITERKQNEENLGKLNRTLRAISNSNQALMRVTDETTFLREACRIIVEDCGYAMVWVGFAEDDEAKSVRPVAYAGFEKGYLDSLKITWADTERGRGPTGRAIRTGQPQFCKNMQTDPTLKPWREDALKRGYNSSIVLPLKSGSKVFGAINMYAKEPNSCSEEEIKLLTELANDFAYGLTMLRLRAEKDRAEAEIRQQAALIDLSPDAIIVRKLEGTITFWSRGAEKLYGWTKTEAIGQVTHNLFKTKFPEPYESIVSNLKRTGAWTGELIHTTKEGNQITVQSCWQPKLGDQGEIVELMESNVDITERKRSEQAIQQAKVEWERTFDSVPDLIAILDKEHRIVRANKAMAQTLGTTPEQCVGLHCYTCVHGTNNPPDFCPHAKTVMDGQEHTEEVYESRLGGDFLVSTTPLMNEEGHMIGSVHMARNITARKQMEKKLEEYARHLEELVEERTQQLRNAERLSAIGETAGMVGHDLRNPLQTVTGETYLAKSELKDIPDSPAKENLEENINIIAEQISYMDKIVSDLQDFVRPVTPDKKPVNLPKLLTATIAEINIPQTIQVDTKIQRNLPEISVDAQLLKRVFINLVTNAVQAMPQGGQLTVKTQKRKTVDGKSRVLIHVEDTGVGIPESVKPKIFRPLFTTKSKGQGFGLAVCRRVIEAHSGTITFESEEGKGAKFTVELPV